ncbi:MAG: flavin reductase family protein [Chitinophagales bacterium]|nr:flavin reductase family protein [Chitinophagales bacterium]
MTIDPKEVSVAKLHAYMLSAIAPRPIAFASTVDKNGIPNLSPFSFFNAFGSNPPTLIFSPARRVRDNTIKHTLENLQEVPEVVINTVNYNMVQQMSLASVEFPKGANEFIKSGFTAIQSDKIKPPRVKESPVQFECKVVEIKPMGTEGGAANLVICEILVMHIEEAILSSEGKIDQQKIDLVARLGADYYVRASGPAIFEVEKPKSRPAIGYDGIPEAIRLSNVLTGNDLGMLGNMERLPPVEEINAVKNSEDVQEIITRFQHDEESLRYHLQLYAKTLLEENKVTEAWKVLLLNNFQA